jgi:hypothetical protein
MELLPGDWEGFDLKSACLQPKFQPAGALRSWGMGGMATGELPTTQRALAAVEAVFDD